PQLRHRALERRRIGRREPRRELGEVAYRRAQRRDPARNEALSTAVPKEVERERSRRERRFLRRLDRGEPRPLALRCGAAAALDPERSAAEEDDRGDQPRFNQHAFSPSPILLGRLWRGP